MSGSHFAKKIPLTVYLLSLFHRVTVISLHFPIAFDDDDFHRIRALVNRIHRGVEE